MEALGDSWRHLETLGVSWRLLEGSWILLKVILVLRSSWRLQKTLKCVIKLLNALECKQKVKTFIFGQDYDAHVTLTHVLHCLMVCISYPSGFSFTLLPIIHDYSVNKFLLAAKLWKHLLPYLQRNSSSSRLSQNKIL